MLSEERHVLTVNKSSVVKMVLDKFSAGAQAQCCVSPETSKGLVEFSKQGFNRLVLNLHVMKTPFAGTSAAYMNLKVCQVGGVLVLTGQVSQPWMLQVEELCRRHFFPRHPLSSFGSLVSRAATGIETSILRVAGVAGRAKAGAGRAGGR